MTKTDKKKFILSLQVINGSGSIEYNVSPTPVTIDCSNSLHTLEFDIDTKQPTTVNLHINKRIGNDSYIQIKNMYYNNINLTNINIISFFKTPQGEISKNHGYINSEGEFVIKLHTNPVSIEYLSYLLSLTT